MTGPAVAPSSNSATIETTTDRLLRWADRAVLRGRMFVAITIIVGLTGDFIGVLVEPHFPAISGIELALAIGTLALAYSSALQAVTALQKRRDDLSPRLDLQILERAGVQPGQLLPTGVDHFFLEPHRWSVHARVRNLGPGNATGVRVTIGSWWQQTSLSDQELVQQIVGQATPLNPILEGPHQYNLVMNAPFSLAANEEYPFDIQIRVPPNLPDAGSPRNSYVFLLQAVVRATGEDVEGNRAIDVRAGVLLQLAIPLHPPAFPGLNRDHEYRTLWRLLTDAETSRIPFIPPS